MSKLHKATYCTQAANNVNQGKGKPTAQSHIGKRRNLHNRKLWSCLWGGKHMELSLLPPTHSNFTGTRYSILYDFLLCQCFSNFPAQACMHKGPTLLICLGEEEKERNVLWWGIMPSFPLPPSLLPQLSFCFSWICFNEMANILLHRTSTAM